MLALPVIANEASRLQRLARLRLFNSIAEEALDEYTQLAASLLDMPAAVLTLVGADTVLCKAATGAAQGLEIDRAISFCGHAIGGDDILEVEDARRDARFADSPVVLGEPHIVHYVGAPLVMPEGERVGTLCAFTRKPGRVTPKQRELLRRLASNVVKFLLLREQECNLQHEKQLANQEFLAEFAPVGLCWSDPRGVVIQVNAHCAKLLGAPSVQECLGSGWESFVSSDDLAAVKRDLWRVVRDRVETQGLFRVRSQGSTPTRWIRYRSAPVISEDGSAGFISALADATHTQELQRQLKEQNRFLQGVIENLPCGVSVYAPDGLHMVSNSRTRALLDVPADLPRDINLTYEQLVRILANRGVYGPVDIEAAVAQRLADFASGEIRQHERELANGSVVEVNGNRMPDGHMVLTYSDVTSRRSALNELHRARNAADAASQAKGEFLATMSHEIRTPINGVIGLSQLLANSHLPQQQAEYVEMISSCAKSLLGLVENILDFSKIEAKMVELKTEPIQLRMLLQEVVDVFAARAAEKDITFRMSVEPQLPPAILGDLQRLRQILLNLLGNALKFTREGGFRLRVTRERRDEGEWIDFAVSDTGVGIAPKDQERLFTRFTQVDASARRNFQGTGLGLAISRELACLMGGDVRLESQLGEGSTFTLRLPLRETGPASESAAIQPEQANPHRAESILLVEDNEINRMVAQGLLSAQGYTNCVTAVNGQEAVDACSKQSFDLILMDCQMPVMDGFEAAATLRAMGVRTPIIALTANAMSKDREKCLSAGMDDYLAKPIEARVLGEMVSRWVSQRSDRPALAHACR